VHQDIIEELGSVLPRPSSPPISGCFEGLSREVKIIGTPSCPRCLKVQIPLSRWTSARFCQVPIFFLRLRPSFLPNRGRLIFKVPRRCPAAFSAKTRLPPSQEHVSQGLPTLANGYRPIANDSGVSRAFQHTTRSRRFATRSRRSRCDA